MLRVGSSSQCLFIVSLGHVREKICSGGKGWRRKVRLKRLGPQRCTKQQLAAFYGARQGYMVYDMYCCVVYPTSEIKAEAEQVPTDCRRVL